MDNDIAPHFMLPQSSKPCKTHPIRRNTMNSQIPRELYPPVSGLLQKSASVSLLGYYPQNQDFPYLYIQAAFLIQAKYPYRYQQPPCEGFCLLYTESGQGMLSPNDGEELPLYSRQLIWIPCSLGFCIHETSPHWNHYLIYFGGRESTYFHSLFLQIQAHRKGIPLSAQSRLPNILQSLNKTGQASFAQPMGQLFLATSLLTEALSHIRHDAEVIDCPPYLMEIRRVLDEEYSYPYSLDMLEQRFHVNKFRIAREFSQYFHESPIAYLTARRIQAAKNLLISTNKQIQEISQEVGYSSPTLFIRGFKKAEQVTPQEYRKRYSRIKD